LLVYATAEVRRRGVGKGWYNSQEYDGERIKWGYEILERLGRWNYQGGGDVHFDEEHEVWSTTFIFNHF